MRNGINGSLPHAGSTGAGTHQCQQAASSALTSRKPAQSAAAPGILGKTPASPALKWTVPRKLCVLSDLCMRPCHCIDKLPSTYYS